MSIVVEAALAGGALIWLDERWEPVRDGLADVSMMMGVFESREQAKALVTWGPALALPLAMAIKISTKELLKILFNKQNVSELSDEETAALMAVIDEQALEDGKDVPAARDYGVAKAGGPKSTRRAAKGEEVTGLGGKGTGRGNLKNGNSVKNIPPHQHDEEGNHLRLT